MPGATQLKIWSIPPVLSDRSENEWRLYRDTQAENEGAAFEGGSIRPLIESGAREQLTRARIADVRRLLVNWEEPQDE
jgi:hypothetical protein